MTRKHSKRQVSFSALLEPEAPLDDRVVLITDPRWRRCLDELRTAAYTGLDTEGYDDSAQAGGDTALDAVDPDGARDFDPFQSQIRLIQVALPSGVCLVADLGGVGDDRAARRRLYGDHGDWIEQTIDDETVRVSVYQPNSFFDVLRDVVESESIPKILHHAKFDALWLRIHFGWRMRCIRCTMLLSQLFWAGLPVRHGLGFLSERAVAAKAPGTWVVSKQLQRSEWRWQLSNAQINYAATDALVVIPLFKWLGSLITQAGMLPAALAECGAVAAFVEFEFNGMPVNPAMLDDHIEMWRRGRDLAIQPFTRRYPGVDPAKTQVVAVALSLDDCYSGYQFYELDELKPRRQPLYILGKRFDYRFVVKQDKYVKETDHSVAEVVLSKFSSLPWISALLDWRSMGVVLKWMENVRRRLRRDGRVRGEYAQIAGGENRGGDDTVGKGMGRSACAKPSLQQSANPQPKLSKLIHQACGFVGDVATMSPRIPFVGHDENAAAYLKWAAARLRGEVADPFRDLDARRKRDAVEGSLEAGIGPQHGGADTTSRSAAGAIVEGVWEEGEDADDFEDSDSLEQIDAVAARAAWYEELAAKWQQRPRQLIVADFSQAHMRIAAQASQDPQLLEDFSLDRDAHLKLAYDFGVATGQVPQDLTIEAFFAWYDKKHPKHKFVKQALRQPAKTGNYTCLNLGSVARLKGAGDTAKPPVVLTYEQWEIIREAWRKRYVVLASYQRSWIRECNRRDVVVDGQHYGVGWSLVSGRRLYLKKEVDKYDRGDAEWCADCQRTHGRLTVRGTDAVAFRWLSSEADAIKWAEDHIVAEFDRHDAYFMVRDIHPVAEVWDARLSSMAHDENDQDCRQQYGLAVAACVRKWFAAGLRWTGVVDVPVEPGDAKDSDLLVRSWADK